jgi:hypothetical protein
MEAMDFAGRTGALGTVEVTGTPSFAEMTGALVIGTFVFAGATGALSVAEVTLTTGFAGGTRVLGIAEVTGALGVAGITGAPALADTLMALGVPDVIGAPGCGEVKGALGDADVTGALGDVEVTGALGDVEVTRPLDDADVTGMPGVVEVPEVLVFVGTFGELLVVTSIHSCPRETPSSAAHVTVPSSLWTRSKPVDLLMILYVPLLSLLISFIHQKAKLDNPSIGHLGPEVRDLQPSPTVGKKIAGGRRGNGPTCR